MNGEASPSIMTLSHTQRWLGKRAIDETIVNLSRCPLIEFRVHKRLFGDEQ